jgi:hypothetical protein
MIELKQQYYGDISIDLSESDIIIIIMKQEQEDQHIHIERDKISHLISLLQSIPCTEAEENLPEDGLKVFFWLQDGSEHWGEYIESERMFYVTPTKFYYSHQVKGFKVLNQ